jgi:hypothetical protein
MRTIALTYACPWSKLILALALFSLTACGGGDKTESTDTPKAPDMDLLAATFMGNTKAVKGHIAAKTDLNQKDPYGSTSLNIAITFGKTEIAGLLIAAGADLHDISADGSSAMHAAGFFGHTEVARQLLANKVDLSIKNSYGVTALEALEVPFDSMKPAYDELAKSLGPLGLKMDYDAIKKARPVIADMIREAQ